MNERTITFLKVASYDVVGDKLTKSMKKLFKMCFHKNVRTRFLHEGSFNAQETIIFESMKKWRLKEEPQFEAKAAADAGLEECKKQEEPHQQHERLS